MNKKVVLIYSKCAAALSAAVAFLALCFFWAGMFVNKAAAGPLAGSAIDAVDVMLFLCVPFTLLPGVYAFAYAWANCIKWRATK